MTASEQFKAEIRRIMKEDGLMLKEVADRAHPPLNRGALSRILHGKHGASVYTVERVADALGCEVILYFRKKHLQNDFQI